MLAEQESTLFKIQWTLDSRFVQISLLDTRTDKRIRCFVAIRCFATTRWGRLSKIQWTSRNVCYVSLCVCRSVSYLILSKTSLISLRNYLLPELFSLKIFYSGIIFSINICSRNYFVLEYLLLELVVRNKIPETFPPKSL